MRLILVAFIFLSCSVIRSKKSPLFSLNKNNLYIVCRATQSKSSLIAHKFNIRDKKITHCGLGFFINDSFKIYNASDVASHCSNALIVDSYDSFIKVQGAAYVGIWEFKLNPPLIRKIIAICDDYNKFKISFDYGFNISNDSALYCSEFCVTVLNKLNYENIFFSPDTIKLDEPLYKSFLKRDTLIYYPVDFFQRSLKFKKVYEHTINR